MDINKKEILELLGVKILNRPPVYTNLNLVGSLNGFFIFPYHYHWVVKGKMPLKYADELYEFRDTLGIRVDGGANENKPIDRCTSDKYEEFLNSMVKKILIIDTKEWSNIMQNKKKELIAENIDSFYVEMYHIDKTEGLKKVIEIIKENNIKTEW